MKRFVLAACMSLPMGCFAAPGDAPNCKTDGTQSELNACTADEFSAADRELNKVYKQILAEYSDEPVYIDKLKVAQRLWLQLRDAEIAARFPVPAGENPRLSWGSSYPMRVDGYRAQLTRERARHLRVWLDGLPEGDLSAGSVHMKQN